MKKFLEQFYNEGFGTTFYKKPIKFINKKIKNKKISNILSIFIKFFYTLIFIVIGVYVLYIKLK